MNRRARTTPPSSRPPHIRSVVPTHSYAGSNSDRQCVGLPGHCERCAEVGHVLAHPNLGCGDVGCTRDHPPGLECDRPAVNEVRRSLIRTIEDIAHGVGPSLDDAEQILDDFAAGVAGDSLRGFAEAIERIMRSEGYDADPARRKAFAEVIDLAKGWAR